MYQKVIIIGNLGADPELRFIPSGTAVTTFSVATNEEWTDSSGEKQERTTWWRVTAWGRLAEICCEYLSKGRQVMIEGRMNPDTETGGPRIWYDNQEDARASYELTAQLVKFLGGRGDGNGSRSRPQQRSSQSWDDEADEIPF